MQTTYLVYLAGAISGLTYCDSVDWRQRVIYGLPDHIKTISPLRGAEFLDSLSKGKPLDQSYEYNPMTSAKGINHRDYWDVQRADVILVNLLGTVKVSIGTVMEIAWARAFNKPVILVMEQDNIHTHPMLEYACSYIVNNMPAAVRILNILCSNDAQLNQNL